jgi:Zn-dependent protease with chaperone function
MPWDPSLISVFSEYFTSNYALAVILSAVVAIAVSFSVFLFSRNHSVKNTSLFSTMAISSSLWIFIFASLAFCVLFYPEYKIDDAQAISLAFRYSLLPFLALGPLAFYLLRKRALAEIYPFFSNSENVQAATLDLARKKIAPIFSDILVRSKLANVSLSVVQGEPRLPASAALDWRGEKVVAISTNTIETLDEEELRAVLAHEFGHLIHKDSLRKTLATAYRTAFVFDPLARFIEAAIYREGELSADEYSARLTGKPAALASALIKIYEMIRPSTGSFPHSAALSHLMRDHESGLLSKQPSLTVRIRKLLELENQLVSNSRA